jgi:hypothetical protein
MTKPKAPKPVEILADDLKVGQTIVVKTDEGIRKVGKVDELSLCGRHHVHVNRKDCYDGRFPVLVLLS